MSTKVAIFRTGLLPPTQTFIPDQVAQFQHFEPVYVGLERVAGGHLLEADPVVLVKRRSLPSRVHKMLYKVTGISPSFHRRIAASGPSVLHAHFILDGIYALQIAVSLKLPLIVTLHAHLPTSFGKALKLTSLDNVLYSLRLSRLWKRASIFICVSDFIRQRAIQLGYPAEKLRVHYIGVDRQLFRPSDRPRDPHLILFVGRLEERKGCNYLIDAMAEVVKQVPRARVVLIGTGSKKAELERQARKLNINAEFLGSIAHSSALLQWLARARLFVGPSVTSSDGDAEALGMVFAEAQATGLPVVSFRHGGIPEVVLDGETGLLATECDSSALVSHILRFLEDEAFWQACSERAVSWIEKRFDLVKQTQELEQIYSSLLK